MHAQRFDGRLGEERQEGRVHALTRGERLLGLAISGPRPYFGHNLSSPAGGLLTAIGRGCPSHSDRPANLCPHGPCALASGVELAHVLQQCKLTTYPPGCGQDATDISHDESLLTFRWRVALRPSSTTNEPATLRRAGDSMGCGRVGGAGSVGVAVETALEQGSDAVRRNSPPGTTLHWRSGSAISPEHPWSLSPAARPDAPAPGARIGLSDRIGGIEGRRNDQHAHGAPVLARADQRRQRDGRTFPCACRIYDAATLVGYAYGLPASGRNERADEDG